MIKQLRHLVILLLDSDAGISEEAYTALKSYTEAVAPGACADIFNVVRVTEGQHYLPAGLGFIT